MTDAFITENFLLQNDRAVELYHGCAAISPSSTTIAIFRPPRSPRIVASRI